VGDHADAVETAVRRLVTEGTLDERQADAVLTAMRAVLPAPPSPSVPPSRPSRPAPRDAKSQPPAAGSLRRANLVELAGYLGGAFVAGAVLLFTGTEWERLSRMSQIVLLTLAILVLAAAGTIVGGGTPNRLRTLGRDQSSTRRRLVATLFLLASAVAATLAAVVVDKAEVAAGGLAGLGVGALGYILVPSLPGQLGCWLFAGIAIVGLLDRAGVVSGLAQGFAILGLGVLWSALAWVRVFAERYSGLGLGAITALAGAQVMIDDKTNAWAYGCSTLVALVCFVGFLKERNWLLLAVGVLAVTLAVPEAIYDWTNGSIGAAGVLFTAGVALLGAAVAGWLLDPSRRSA
jgi:hypothetical protein